MKITHLSNSDIIGGAGIASYRIHKALLKKGHKYQLFVNNYYSGEFTVSYPINYGFPTYYLGQLKDSYSLKALYSASDILLLPSRVESFCNTACEAQSCGIPVLSYEVGGLIDIINHKKTGYLASPFDIKDFAKGIIWISDQINLDKKLNNLARKRAIKNWDYSVVAKKYETLYQEIISNKSKL